MVPASKLGNLLVLVYWRRDKDSPARTATTSIFALWLLRHSCRHVRAVLTTPMPAKQHRCEMNFVVKKQGARSGAVSRLPFYRRLTCCRRVFLYAVGFATSRLTMVGFVYADQSCSQLHPFSPCRSAEARVFVDLNFSSHARREDGPSSCL